MMTKEETKGMQSDLDRFREAEIIFTVTFPEDFESETYAELYFCQDKRGVHFLHLSVSNIDAETADDDIPVALAFRELTEEDKKVLRKLMWVSRPSKEWKIYLQEPKKQKNHNNKTLSS